MSYRSILVRLRRHKVIALLVTGLALATGIPLAVHALDSSNSLAIVDLTGTPFYATTARAKPTLTLALSMEFPSVGAQYRDSDDLTASSDSSYSASQAYVGYFNNKSCYQYVNNDDEEYRRFKRSGSASSTHTCTDGESFSGNFMNWATTSAVDILRLGLTGGDRYIDEEDLTILQRAILPLGQGKFWNDVNFPSKQITVTNASGLVPTALIGDYTGTLYISNTLNRVHFGYETQTPSTTATRASLPLLAGHNSLVQSTAPSSSFATCAAAGKTCTVTSRSIIAYGNTISGTSKWIYLWATAGSSITCSAAGLGLSKNPWTATGTTNICKSLTVSDTSYGTTGATSLTADNFFYTRVQVCDSDAVTVETDCALYSSGYYKPIGNLQKYSDRVRVAVFGYLLDSSESRYGGVLRVPMKYVGPHTYDITGQTSSTNSTVEWSTTTGIFKTNPDSATSFSRSGVINYLNKVGRLNTTTTTPYKSNDPIAELYYESLRYLQGLAPTSAAWKNWATAATDEDFPVYTTWTDPWADGSSSTDYSCVKNNILVFGDQWTHYDQSIPGTADHTLTSFDTTYEFTRSASLEDNEPDFVAWTNAVGTLEKAQGNAAPNSGLVSSVTWPTIGQNVYSESGIYSNGSSHPGYLMAGMAYWAHINDIRGTDWTNDTDKQRPGMRVTTYMLDANTNGLQSTSTYRYRSPNFLAAKYGGFTVKDYTLTDNTPFNNGNSWEKDDDAGEAQTFFLSDYSSAQEVLDALDDIFVSIVSQANSIANGAISSSTLSSSTTGYLYNAQFDASDWSGDIVATPLTLSGSTVTVGSAAWSAATLLSSRTDERNIVVGNTDHSSSVAVDFTWDTIETTLQTALNKASSSSTSSDGYGEERVAYLRGATTNEGTLFRSRSSLLGDIINSGVVLSGTPSTTIVDSDYYTSSFYSTAKSRTAAIFAGANDGMLHAFNATTGKELFGYIPSWVATNLSELTQSTYVADGHQSYVDATPAVTEAKVGSSSSGTWKTVLVSGTGGGGQGVFALDVSDPTSFSTDSVMWEFTDADDASLGNVMAAPQILKFAIKSGTTTTYKWFAVVAGGVNNYAKDSNYDSSGEPALFLLDLAHTGTDDWVENSDYFKISLPIDSSLTTASGAVTFTAQLGSAGQVLKIYVGDLHGQLWRLDFSTVSTTPVPTGNELPLFIAQDDSSVRQPISVAPLLIPASSTSTVVAFGTGKYMESDDYSNTDTQSFYAILDGGDTDEDDSTGSIISKSRLLEASISSGAISTGSFTWGKQSQWNSSSSIYAGWYFDFPASSTGERQVADGKRYGSYVIFNSLIPQTSSSSDPCVAGTSNQYVINVSAGTGTVSASTMGVLASPMVVDSDDDDTVSYSTRNSVGKRTKTVTKYILQQGSSGISTTAASFQVSLLVGRLSWRQILNYAKLHYDATE